VIISRGELVQIGGGFRIGEILEASSAQVREVGATNKTRLEDYRRAIRKETALILKVHRSNFSMSGFVESPSSEEISALAHRRRIPFVEDLGSGAVVTTEELGIADHEPTPAEALKSGVDLVCFSGDKLFGGPQAGIIAGKKRLVAALKREPLFRALRCDKLCLAALQSTVDLQFNHATAGIPALALLQIPEDELRARAAEICDQLSKKCTSLQIAIGRGAAKAGGGTLPKSTMPSVTIDIVPKNSSLADFAATLRAWNPPVIGYIAGNRFKLDLHTIFPQQDASSFRRSSQRARSDHSAFHYRHGRSRRSWQKRAGESAHGNGSGSFAGRKEEKDHHRSRLRRIESDRAERQQNSRRHCGCTWSRRFRTEHDRGRRLN